MPWELKWFSYSFKGSEDLGMMIFFLPFNFSSQANYRIVSLAKQTSEARFLLSNIPRLEGETSLHVLVQESPSGYTHQTFPMIHHAFWCSTRVVPRSCNWSSIQPGIKVKCIDPFLSRMNYSNPCSQSLTSKPHPLTCRGRWHVNIGRRWGKLLSINIVLGSNCLVEFGIVEGIVLPPFSLEGNLVQLLAVLFGMWG